MYIHLQRVDLFFTMDLPKPTRNPMERFIILSFRAVGFMHLDKICKSVNFFIAAVVLLVHL